jgi:class 3 adenylate cyclase
MVRLWALSSIRTIRQGVPRTTPNLAVFGSECESTSFKIVTDSISGKKAIARLLDPARHKFVGPPDDPMVHEALDNFYISMQEVQRMVEQSLNSRPTGHGQRLGDARNYIAGRRIEIGRVLREKAVLPHRFVDRSEDCLASLPDGVYGFAIISIDLADSTKLSNPVNPETFARVIGVVLGELAAIIPYFHGHALKFTGDGATVYSPPPSSMTANDNAIDCELTMRRLVLDGVNPAFAETGYSSLNVRIGIESGGAVAMTVGHSSSKQRRDPIGHTLDIACKIQASGQRGDIRIGQVAYQSLHTMWKRGCTPIPPPEPWPYKLVEGGSYPIYLFSSAGALLD